MSAQLASQRKEYEAQLEIVDQSLKEAENDELLNIKEEILNEIRDIDNQIAHLKAANVPTPDTAKKQPLAPIHAEEKWSRENHPAFKKSVSLPEKEPEVANYKVNDTVLAKWVSGDKGFYPSRITAITGSKTDPMYTVKFKNYDNVETLRGKDIRPVAQKRKADGPASAGASIVNSMVATMPTTAGSGIVMSAGAALYPQAMQQKQMAENGLSDDKPRPKYKKIKAHKELEAGKNKWQEFNAKGKVAKGTKKETMFRTPEGINGRVGFTGSGQAMRKDPTRTRHVYQPNEDLD